VIQSSCAVDRDDAGSLACRESAAAPITNGFVFILEHGRRPVRSVVVAWWPVSSYFKPRSPSASVARRVARVGELRRSSCLLSTCAELRADIADGGLARDAMFQTRSARARCRKACCRAVADEPCRGLCRTSRDAGGRDVRRGEVLDRLSHGESNSRSSWPCVMSPGS